MRVQRPEVVVIGGGIVGTTAAALLAEAGAAVLLVERTELAAGASGRNLGAVQHPFDPILAPLHGETLTIYRELADADAAFPFPSAPAGLLLLATESELGLLAASAHDIAATAPELEPRVLDRDDLRAVEPLLAPDLAACRLATGYPIPPQAATHAMARRARAAGAVVEIGATARPRIADGRAAGVELSDGRRIAADAVLVAAGPWTPELIDPSGVWRPIVRTWGATVQLALAPAPRHVVEEARVETVNRPAAEPSGDPPSLFALTAAGGVAALGSTFLATEPDHARLAPLLVDRGARFVPALRGARIVGSRACARPQSVDGRPFIGPLGGIDGLFMCAGHGPWGISTGPAAARMVADAMLGRATHPIPAALGVRRMTAPPIA